MRWIWLLLAVATCAAAGDRDDAEAAGRRLAHAFVDQVYNQRHPERIDTFVHVEFTDRSPGAPAEAHGPAWVKRQYAETYGAFPDLRFTLDDVMADGDKVVLRWTSRGTFTGVLGNVRGKGQKIEIQGISIFRVQDGKIAESWDLVDRAGLFRQAGFVLQPPTQE